MARKYLERIGQGQQFPVNAVVEFPCILPRMPGQIGPSYSAHKQGVAREHKPWIAAATMISHHQTDTLRRVAWGMQYHGAGVAEFDRLAVVKPGECQRHIRRFMQII